MSDYTAIVTPETEVLDNPVINENTDVRGFSQQLKGLLANVYKGVVPKKAIDAPKGEHDGARTSSYLKNGDLIDLTAPKIPNAPPIIMTLTLTDFSQSRLNKVVFEPLREEYLFEDSPQILLSEADANGVRKLTYLATIDGKDVYKTIFVKNPEKIVIPVVTYKNGVAEYTTNRVYYVNDFAGSSPTDPNYYTGNVAGNGAWRIVGQGEDGDFINLNAKGQRYRGDKSQGSIIAAGDEDPDSDGYQDEPNFYMVDLNNADGSYIDDPTAKVVINQSLKGVQIKREIVGSQVYIVISNGKSSIWVRASNIEFTDGVYKMAAPNSSKTVSVDLRGKDVTIIGSQSMGGDYKIIQLIGIDDNNDQSYRIRKDKNGNFFIVYGNRVVVEIRDKSIQKFELNGNVYDLKRYVNQSLERVWRSGNDQLGGDDSDEYISGYGGNDTIWGQGGSDHLYGGSNKDTLYGGKGDDFLYGETGNDKLYGEEGTDFLFGGVGNDKLYGGKGNDRLYGDIGEDILYGEEGNDYLYGDGGNDLMFGGDGNDWMNGSQGDDVLHGGIGSDALFGNVGNDTLHGEEGIDHLYGDVGNDKLYGGDGNDKLYGDLGDDQLSGGNDDDILYGGSGNDILNGDSGNDVLKAGNGNDILSGGLGSDTLYGNQGNDTLDGGYGNDTLAGNEGNDTLTGGSGLDRFVFTERRFGKDVITDFDAGGESSTADILVFNKSIVKDFGTLLGKMTQSGSDTIITISKDNTVTLKNFNKDNLHFNDVRFI